MSSGGPCSPEPQRRDAVIFDVDGTLCDVRLIRHFVQAPDGATKFKPNFNRFHSASKQCPPHLAVRQLAHRAQKMGLAVIVATGREATWAQLTTDWLSSNDIPFDELWTRGAKDYRPDHVIKAEMELRIRQRFNALLAVDDRLDIIEVWQAAGIATVQVDPDGEILPVRLPAGPAQDQRVHALLTERSAR